MNNYFKNQIRRANCTLPKKAALWLLGVLRPGLLRRLWADHVGELQAELEHLHSLYPYGCRVTYLQLHPELGQSSLVRR